MIITTAKILAILYAGLFTVFAVLSGAENIDGVKGLLLNLPNVAPWLLVWVALFVAWKSPRLGGILFLLLAVASMLFFNSYKEIILFSVISLPLIVIGILFLIKTKNN